MAAMIIDLGTRFVRVAEYRNDVYMLDSTEVIPSRIAISGREQLIFGEELEEQMDFDSTNTVLPINQPMGRKLNSSKFVQKIYGMLLEQLKEKIEKRRKKKVTSAVITVSAGSSEEELEATRSVCQLAGFSQVELLDEPTAAAWSVPNNLLADGKTLLIYDFGGGTLDISIQRFEGGAFTVLAKNEDTQLGGLDVDNRLVKYFRQTFEGANHCSLEEERKVITRLERACERLKVMLSNMYHADVSIKNFYQGKDFKLSLSRAKFNELNNDLFTKTIKITKDTLQNARMDKHVIDTVLMIGGSSLIPRVREKLEEEFGKHKVCCSIDPEWAVMRGAVKYTGHKTMTDDVLRASVNQLGKLSSTICLKTVKGVMITSIKEDSTLPARSVKYIQTSENEQSKISMNVWQSGGIPSSEGQRLGSLVIDGIPPARAGKKKVLIRMVIDMKGLVNVFAFLEEDNGEKKCLSVQQLGGDEQTNHP